MKKYKIKIKNPDKEDFIKQLLKEFGLIEEKPNTFTEKKKAKKATTPKKNKKK